MHPISGDMGQGREEEKIKKSNYCPALTQRT